ncbi:MAG: hypothetical protein HQK58_14180 [Deltaproteobacteria bacterium]|nr:hypothetical protein [Deltaproteobacteria bacterium]
MSVFDRILPKTLEWEGGSKFTEDPADPGGATRYGISLRFLRGLGQAGDIDHDGDVDAGDIRALTEDQASEFYRREFWDKCLCDELPDQVAMAVFDTAVNLGVPRAVKMLQSEANAVLLNNPLVVDGRMGKNTVDGVLDAVNLEGSDKLTLGYLNRRLRFYFALAKAPARAKYLRGWTRRVAALKEVIKGAPA